MVSNFLIVKLIHIYHFIFGISFFFFLTLDDTKWHIEIRDQWVRPARGTKKKLQFWIRYFVIFPWQRRKWLQTNALTKKIKMKYHTYHVGAKTDGRYFHAIIQFNERNFICHVDQTNRSEWNEFYNVCFFFSVCSPTQRKMPCAKD